jgi:hypothetical protein
MIRFISRPKSIHIEAIKWVMNYCAGYKDIVWILKSNGEWNGKINDNSNEVVVILDSNQPKILKQEEVFWVTVHS